MTVTSSPAPSSPLSEERTTLGYMPKPAWVAEMDQHRAKTSNEGELARLHSLVRAARAGKTADYLVTAAAQSEGGSDPLCFSFCDAVPTDAMVPLLISKCGGLLEFEFACHACESSHITVKVKVKGIPASFCWEGRDVVRRYYYNDGAEFSNETLEAEGDEGNHHHKVSLLQ